MNADTKIKEHKLEYLEEFDPGQIISEYVDIEIRTDENQRRLADLLRRDPSVQNFSDVYSIVQRLLEAEKKEDNVSSSGRPDTPYSRYVSRQIDSGDIGLEIGCAQGRLTEHLTKQAKFIVGIDSSRDAIVTAIERSGGTSWGENCAFFATDARDLKDFRSTTFDFAISTEVIEHLGMPGFILHMDQLKRVLKKGGKYFVTCPSALICGTEGDLHIRMYYFRELHQLAKMLGFGIAFTVNVKNKVVFGLPSFLNPLVILYESFLRHTRLNYLFNYMHITILCLPMSVVFIKKEDSDEIRTNRKKLKKMGFYHG